MAQIRVKLSSATRVNGKTIPAGARQVNERDAAVLRGMPGVEFLDEVAAAPVSGVNSEGEFVINRVAIGADARKIDADMAAHIEAIKGSEPKTEAPAEVPAPPVSRIARPKAEPKTEAPAEVPAVANGGEV